MRGFSDPRVWFGFDVMLATSTWRKKEMRHEGLVVVLRLWVVQIHMVGTHVLPTGESEEDD